MTTRVSLAVAAPIALGGQSLYRLLLDQHFADERESNAGPL